MFFSQLIRVRFVVYPRISKFMQNGRKTVFLSKIKDFYLNTKIFGKHCCFSVFQQAPKSIFRHFIRNSFFSIFMKNGRKTVFCSKIKDFYLNTKIFCKHCCFSVFQRFQLRKTEKKYFSPFYLKFNFSIFMKKCVPPTISHP